MTADLLTALLTTQLLYSSNIAAPDPCGLVSSADIASALGSKPTPGTKTGPTRDEDTGADVSSCSLGVGDDLFLMIAVAEFSTGSAASAALKETEKLSLEDEDAVRMSQETGVGQHALWGANANGAIWIAHKGKYMLNVTLGGKIGDGAKYRDPLKRLATVALSKL